MGSPVAPPPGPHHSPVVTRRILRRLEGQHPGAFTELMFRNAYELLVATILSAQCTDVRVNAVTPALFARYPTARALAAADPRQIEPLIRSTGVFRAKSRSLMGMACALVERHRGQVPADIESLVSLPGVGRKTANVVLGHALGVPGLPVIGMCCGSPIAWVSRRLTIRWRSNVSSRPRCPSVAGPSLPTH